MAAAAMLASTGSARPAAIGPPTFGQIAYFNYDGRDKGTDVMLMNTNGSGATNITHDGTAKRNVDPNWSANGLKLAFTRYSLSGGADIMVINSNGTGLVNVTGPGLIPGVLNVHPTWSRDGSIVFASNRDGNFDLYKIGTATDRLVQMTKTQAPVQNLDPDYSADGKMLVFSRTSGPATNATTASLFTMRSIAGTPVTRLTKSLRGAGDHGAAWSPNGQKIAFQSDRTGTNALYVISWNGSGLTKVTTGITTSAAADREPTWAPNGTTLAFLSNRSGYTEVWMTNIAGMTPGPSPAWQVTFNKETKGAPDWQPASPVPMP